MNVRADVAALFTVNGLSLVCVGACMQPTFSQTGVRVSYVPEGYLRG